MDVTVQAGRCDHCARVVRVTVHQKGGARVDYYRCVTGVPREDSMEDRAGTGETVRVVRIEGLHEILTCKGCWEKPGVRRDLDEARRTGRLPRPVQLGS